MDLALVTLFFVLIDGVEAGLVDPPASLLRPDRAPAARGESPRPKGHGTWSQEQETALLGVVRSSCAEFSRNGNQLALPSGPAP